MQADGMKLLERLRELPAGRLLLELAAGRQDVELVGGAARDLLLGRSPRELDVVVDGPADAFAGRIAAIVDCRFAADDGSRCGVERHERFGTASVAWKRGRIDVAARRAESYAAPGALPEVRGGTPDEDLQRRDFTVNAIAVPLSGVHRAQLRTAPHALEDLAAGRLRVLHEQSFIDDPTRLLRLARYRARLQFAPEQRTAALAQVAIDAGALTTISRARFGAELRLALCEEDPIAALEAFDELGALAALHPAIRFEPALARDALAELPPDGRAELLLLATLLLGVADRLREGVEIDRRAESDEHVERALRALLDELELGAEQRDVVARAATYAQALSDLLGEARTPWQVREAAYGEPPEAIALAAALGDAQDRPEAVAAARRWFSDWRDVRLQINGDDLIEAGLAPGPQIGYALARVLRLRLDGELAGGRDAELGAALEGT
jgi:tRNA nucleotidyltransferase (CCA-adding enzyme)